MLSISNMSLEKAATYYQEENYYSKEFGEFYSKSKLLNQLGFTQELSHEHFIKMLKGQNAKGEQLRQGKQNGDERAGYDHTFTAPKSLSVLLEIAEAKGDLKLAQKLRDIHERSVNSTLEHIQDNYIFTRVQKDGKRVYEKTDNMIVAKFQHDTSRVLDPTLHTHCLIANYTLSKDGEYRAISNEKLYENKISNGQYYRSELARSLKELGYEIDIIDTKKALFEIKGIDKELIEEFSKRSEQIKVRTEELRLKYPKASEAELKQMATLETRTSKDKNVDRSKVYTENLQRAASLVDTDELLNKFQIKENASIKTDDINELIKHSAEILTELESTFTKEDILKTATKLSLGTARASDIFNSIENNPELIKLDENTFTTQEMLDIEKSIVEYTLLNQNQSKSISNHADIKNFINKKYPSMTQGQKDAITHITTSKDVILGIQGDAGTGKTFMLKALNEYTNKDEFELIGAAFTGKAASELEDQSNIKSHTLHSILNKEPEDTNKNRIYIVDEASLVGSKQLHQLIEKAKEENARIVLLGDTKQFTTISAGAIFDQLQQLGMNTAYMSEALRQKTQVLKEVVKHIKQENTDLAFELLEKEDATIQESQNIVKTVLDAYKEKPESLIISSKNSIRKEINAQIREIKSLSNQQSLLIRESTNLMGTEQFFAQNYEKNQIAIINQNIPGIKPGTLSKIKNVNVDNQTIEIELVSNDKTIHKTINIKKYGNHISTFNELEKDFGIGEKIMFTKNDKMLNVKNGETAIINNIDELGNIEVLKDDKTIKFNLKDYQYFDYGYCTTDYKAQGATANDVIIAADSKMANHNSFYVQITRAKNSVKIFTDDLETLKEKVTQKQIKKSTLSYLQEVTKSLKQHSKKLGVTTEKTQLITNEKVKNIINQMEENKDARREKQNTRTSERRNLIRACKNASRNLETASNNFRDTQRSFGQIDNTRIRGTVAERISEREFRDIKRDKQQSMKDVIESLAKYQSYIKDYNQRWNLPNQNIKEKTNEHTRD